MADTLQATRPTEIYSRSVQEYIDELPLWSDGTQLTSTPMTGMQKRIWALAAAGKFFEGFVVFMTGVALPLVAREFHILAGEKGIISAASLAGILFGALLLGGMSDHFGRKRMFIAEMIIFCAFLALLILCNDFLSLAICLFGLGLALGCDYPTAHMIISENIPSSSRGGLVLGAFGFQALGALGGTAIGYFVLVLHPTLDAWRWMYATALIPAIAVTVGRFFIVESASWLSVRGHHDRAEHSVSRLLAREPVYPAELRLLRHNTPAEIPEPQAVLPVPVRQSQPPRHDLRLGPVVHPGPRHLRHRHFYARDPRCGHRRRADHVRSLSGSDQRRHPGRKGRRPHRHPADRRYRLGVILADSVGRIKLQIFGFIGCAIGLLIASFSIDVTGGMQIAFIFAGFMLFNFMTNMGPNAQTYLLAGEVFPTIFAAWCGFCRLLRQDRRRRDRFPLSLSPQRHRNEVAGHGLVVSSLPGAIVTWIYRIETTGVNLEEIGR